MISAPFQYAATRRMIAAAFAANFPAFGHRDRALFQRRLWLINFATVGTNSLTLVCGKIRGPRHTDRLWLLLPSIGLCALSHLGAKTPLFYVLEKIILDVSAVKCGKTATNLAG